MMSTQKQRHALVRKYSYNIPYPFGTVVCLRNLIRILEGTNSVCGSAGSEAVVMDREGWYYKQPLPDFDLQFR